MLCLRFFVVTINSVITKFACITILYNVSLKLEGIVSKLVIISAVKLKIYYVSKGNNLSLIVF